MTITIEELDNLHSGQIIRIVEDEDGNLFALLSDDVHKKPYPITITIVEENTMKVDVVQCKDCIHAEVMPNKANSFCKMGCPIISTNGFCSLGKTIDEQPELNCIYCINSYTYDKDRFLCRYIRKQVDEHTAVCEMYDKYYDSH